MSIRRPFHPVALVATLALLTPVATAAQSRSILQLLPTEGRQLTVGAEETGALSSSDVLSPDDAFMEAWALSAGAGDLLTVDLESDDFDPTLYIAGPGLSATLFDDDSGNGCNARITFTALESGAFHVVATSLGIRETGTYVLRVSSTEPPPSAYECGQADPSQLMALPTDGRSLSMGAARTGTLGPFSPTAQDGRPAEAWSLEGRAGERVSIVMQSEMFDAYLYLIGPGIQPPLTDDDGAGNLDARIDATLPMDGTYTVIASSFGDDANGSYSIRVEEPLDPLTLPTDGRVIAPGQSTTGTLSAADPVVLDGRRGQLWELAGEAGQTVTIELRSDEFDAYLYLAGPGIVAPLSDDDGAGDLNSRLTATLPESGSYRIVVSALSAESFGGYTLTVR